MDDLIAFLRARLDEREKVALAACGDNGSAGRWRQEDPHREPGRIEDDLNDVVTYDEGSPTAEQARHIAENDPRYVLDDIAAKRRLLDFAIELWKTEPSAHPLARVNRQATHIMRLLALPFAGHPDYREDWKP